MSGLIIPCGADHRDSMLVRVKNCGSVEFNTADHEDPSESVLVDKSRIPDLVQYLSSLCDTTPSSADESLPVPRALARSGDYRAVLMSEGIGFERRTRRDFMGVDSWESVLPRDIPNGNIHDLFMGAIGL